MTQMAGGRNPNNIECYLLKFPLDAAMVRQWLECPGCLGTRCCIVAGLGPIEHTAVLGESSAVQPDRVLTFQRGNYTLARTTQN